MASATVTVSTPTISPADLEAYLKKHAPDIAALIAKDFDDAIDKLTPGDAHATTAIGNGDDEGKAKDGKTRFASLVAQAAEARTGDKKTEENAEKAEWTIPFDILKAVPEQQMIFGWASVSEKDGKLIIDKQDDVILPEELEKAAYEFVLYSRTGGDMHVKKGTARLIESMVFTKEKQDVMGINLGLVGWWVGFKVDDPNVWEAHKRGDRPEFSIGGKAVRVPV